MLVLLQSRTSFAVVAASWAVLATHLSAGAPSGNEADYSRTGYTAQELPTAPVLQWTHTPRHPPRPAWPDPGKEWNRLAFDYVHAVSHADGLLFYGTSADHQVRALDLATGRERWHFVAGGPIRFAPAVAEGRVYVPCDDGVLYCLSAASGDLVWTFDAAPRREFLIGNEQLISRWPMRSSVIVRDSVVYCTAGMWTSEGVYVFALNASDGSVIWKDDSSAEVYQKMPHDNSESIAGLSPQGYLLLHGDTLIVPTGRSTPVGFDAQTGRRLYMRTNFTKRHHPGSSWLLATNGLVFSERRCPRMIRVLPGPKGPSGSEGIMAWDHRTGAEMLAFTGKHRMTTDGRRLFLSGKGTLWGCDLEAFLEIGAGIRRRNVTGDVKETLLVRSPAHDPASPWSRVNVHPEQLGRYAPAKRWEVPLGLTYTLIQAGSTVVAGLQDEVAAFHAETGSELWRLAVKGDVCGLVVAGGRLIVSTTSGQIACFGAPGPGVPPVRQRGHGRVKTRARTSERVRSILSENTLTGGYAFVLGAGDGTFAAELARRSGMHVCVLERESERVTAVRESLRTHRAYGTRVTVLGGELERVRYPPYFASLIVLDSAFCGTLARIDLRQIYRSLRPHGGIMWLQDAVLDAQAVTGLLARHGVPAAECGLSREGSGVVVHRGALPEEGTWTHKYADAGRSSASAEKNIRFPLRMLWFGGVGPGEMTDRHWQGSPPLYSSGRMFLQGTYDVMAVDAYTGRELWRRHFSELRRVGFRFRGGSIVADERHVYAILGQRCVQLDAATGGTVREYAAPISAESAATLAKDLSFVYFPARVKGWQKQLKRAEKWREEGHDPEIIGSGTLYPGRNDPVWEFLAVTDDAVIGSFGVPHPVIQHTAYAVPEVPYVFALDKVSGELRWLYRAEESVDPEAIAIQGNALYLIDRTAEAKLTRAKHRQEKIPLTNTIKALDLTTGNVLWSKPNPIPGCRRMWTSPTAMVLTAKPKLAVLSLPDGEHLWGREKIPFSSKGGMHIYPNVLGNMLYVNPHIYDLRTGEMRTMTHPLTGEATPVRVGFRYGCGVNSFCESGMFFRGGSAGMYDLAGLSGTHWLGNVRSGCWQNIIPAGGLVLMPESASGCTCPYNYQTSLAMVPGERLENWSAITVKAPTTVTRAAVNIGAPGDQRDQAGEGRLWLTYPRAHRPDDALQLPLVAWGKQVSFYHRSADDVPVKGTSKPWVYTSGLEGVQRMKFDFVYSRPAVCPPVRVPPLIDGRLDDACWDGCHPLILRGVDQIVAAETDVYLRHDGNGLYLGYRRRAPLRDGKPVPWTANASGDHVRVWQDDSFNLRLWKRPRAVWIDVSASGAVFAVASSRGKGKDNRSTQMVRLDGITHAVHMTPHVWTAEVALPWEVLKVIGAVPRDPRLTAHIESRNRSGIGAETVFYRYRLEGRNEGGGMRAVFDGRTSLVYSRPPPSRERTYCLRLHFAELDDTVVPGERVFDVWLQGKKVADGIDIVREAGPRHALVREFRGVSCADALEIQFRSRSTQRPALISGFEVVEEE